MELSFIHDMCETVENFVLQTSHSVHMSCRFSMCMIRAYAFPIKY